MICVYCSERIIFGFVISLSMYNYIYCSESFNDFSCMISSFLNGSLYFSLSVWF